MLVLSLTCGNGRPDPGEQCHCGMTGSWHGGDDGEWIGICSCCGNGQLDISHVGDEAFTLRDAPTAVFQP